jgi:amino acid adenylation domain-containing protein
VGAEESFFELGGHSLLATRVISRLRQAFGVEVPLRALFESPTVAGLTTAIERLRRAGGGLEAPPLETVPRDGNLPLSFAQQRLWFLDQLEPESAAYNIPFALTLRGELSQPTLALALSEVVRRHEGLRTLFIDEEGEPVQRILPATPFKLPLIDLGDLPSSLRGSEAARLAAGEAGRPFDLSRSSLVRAALLRLGSLEHVALFTLHHIVSDGWSAGILVREVGELYAAFAAGSPSPLPDLPIQYADYAAWQRRWLVGEALEAQLSHWSRRISGAPPLLALPADRPRPPISSGRGGVRSLQVSGAAFGAVMALARRHGATPFMALLAAFEVLLSRYTGTVDFVVGTDVANRNRTETESLIGFFVNQLVLRADLSGDPSFATLLERVRETALDAYDHQDLPFEMLVEELRPDRDLSRHPVFQVTFAFESTSVQRLELPGLELGPFPVRGTTAKFDLSVAAAANAEGIVLSAEYSSDLFDPTTIDRLLGHFGTLLAASAALPSLRVSAFPMLSDAEWHQVTAGWNDTATAYRSRGVCFPEIFSVRAAASPEAIAASCRGEALAYGALARQSNRLARRLVACGVGRESVVPLLGDRGLGFLTAILGILNAGGAYLPLDPLQPMLRVAGILAGCGASVVVVQRDYLPSLEAALAAQPEADRPRLLVLEDLLASLVSAAPLPPISEPSDLAYVIFTSGSTGTPKGAMLEHRGLLNHMWGMVDAFGLTAGDVVAQTASQSFDISVWQFLTALLVGGRVQIVPDEVTHDPEQLALEVEREAITLLEIVPSLLRVMQQILLGWGEGRPTFPRLRWLIPTGEALPAELSREWLRLYPHVPLVNAYGPTECSDDVTLHPLRVPPDREVLITSIGRPMANSQVFVLDRDLSPLPFGVPGELFVGGTGVGRGYLRDSGRTAESFLPNPFAGTGERFYRTGDLARWLTDGSLEYLGRADYQVKVRGHRIELGEVEAVLADCPLVRDAVVLVREDMPGDRRLVAYVVLAGESVERLRAFAGERLPAWMVPAAFVVLDAFPLTPNGKLDRRALPAPEQLRPDLDNEYVAPRGLVAEELAAIWAEVLGVDRVGAQDNFFDLGGHSLIATQVAARTWKHFAVRLPLRELFLYPTVESLAARLEKEMLEKVDNDRMRELLLLLEGVDDEEAARALDLGVES